MPTSAELQVMTAAQTKSVVVGDEHDERMIASIRSMLAGTSVVRQGRSAVIVGSQEIETYRFTLDGAAFDIEFETYAGITITGEAETVDRVIELIAAHASRISKCGGLKYQPTDLSAK